MNCDTLTLIDTYVTSMPIRQWAPLTAAERDLVRRALAP